MQGETNNDVVVIQETSSVRFYCVVSSNPESYIEILHDGKRLASFNNTSDLTYDIARSKCEDAGVYTCSAINEVNPEPTTVALDYFVDCNY